MHRSTLLNVLVGLLLASSILAGLTPSAGAQAGLPPGHDALIKANQGPAAPYGSWTRVGEEVTLFLDRESTYPVNATPVGTPAYEGANHAPAGNGDAGDDYFLTYEKNPTVVTDVEAPELGALASDYSDPNDKKVIVEYDPVQDTLAAARWTVPLDLSPKAPIRVYGIEAEIHADCLADAFPSTTAGDLPDVLWAEVDILDLQDDGTWERRDMVPSSDTHQAYQAFGLALSSIGIGVPSVYSREIRFDNPLTESGRLFEPASMRLQFSLLPGAALGNGACVIHFGSASFPSFARVLSDSGRINMWHENTFGEETQGVSNATRTGPERRRFLTQVIHASAWPMLNQYRRDRPDPVNYQDDFFDLQDTASNPTNPGPGDVVQGSSMHYRVRDLRTIAIVSGTGANDIQTLDRDVFVLGSGLNRIEYLMFYPASLPDGRYRAEVASSEFGAAIAPDLTVGVKGFTFTPLDGLTHAVNPKEPTEFRFRVRNVGGEDDTVTVVATPPGSSWVAEIVGGSTHFLRAGGGEAEVVLRVTPPDGAVAPATQAITVTASSATFPGELTPITQTVQVNVVSAVKRGVDLTLNRTAITLQPGVDTSLAGVRVRNTGTAADTFVLQPSLPGSAVGWTVQATPLSKLILANSSSDFSLRLRAPVDAPAGQTFTVPVRATRLGDSTVTDVIDLTVTIVVRHGLETAFPVSLTDTLPAGFEAYMAPRDTGPTCPAGNVQTVQGNCVGSFGIPTPAVPDDANDDTFLYRLLVTNPGSVPDTYRVTMSWQPRQSVNGVPYTDSDGSIPIIAPVCDGNDGDSPDYWRVRYGLDGQGLSSSAPFQDFITKVENGGSAITVPAGGVVPAYFQFQWIPSVGNCIVSKVAPFRVVLRSGNDPSLERTVEFATQLIPAGTRTRPNDFTAAVHDAEIEADWTDLDRRAGGERGTTSSHLLRIRNSGNELDNTIVSVPAGSNGWARTLTQVGSVPSGITCTGNQAGTRFVCPLTVYDEAVFRLNVTSPTTAAVGAFDTASVGASSANGAAGNSLDFVTTVLGTFQFDAQGLLTTLSAEKGKTALLPFVLKNQGTAGDRLNLSLIQGDSAWTPRLGLPQSNFVPGGRELSGFIAVTPPADATASKLFRLQVTSAGNGAIDIVDFTVTPVAAGALRLSGLPSNVTTIAQAGVPQQVRVNVVEPGGAAGRGVRVDVAGSLPNGWTVTPTSTSVTLAGATNPNATAVFTVTAPAGSLGNSRLPLLLDADSTSGTAVSGQGNLLLQLADVFGVKLAAAGPTNQTIVPGGQVVYNMTVANLGTSTDTIRFATSGAPAGWTVQSDPPELALGPLENRTVKLLVKAPANAAPKALATTTMQASSLGSGAVSSVITTTRVGFYELLVGNGSDSLDLAPTESGSLVFSVKNNGSLPDEVAILPALANAGVAGQVTMRADPAVVALAPNQTREVRVEVTLGNAPPSDSDITASIRFDSRLAPDATIANVTRPLRLHVLPYVGLDVDGDGIQEYAIDRADDDDGFESYLDTGAGGGRPSQVADLGRFLTAEGREKHTRSIALANGTTVEVVDVVVDGDGDQKRDLFVDSGGDGLPDHYWDPDEAHAHDLDIFQDVDGDAVVDYFVDTGGAAGVDAVYDLRTATFTPVLTLDIDGDGTNDYLVDKNSNGKLDADETVLYSRGDGGLVGVQKIDMDGSGELDSVFDIDGDGVPDYFIPAGEEATIEIVLKDVNGDGVADWAYDADGDGRLDSYYDPETKKASLIDAKDSFAKALVEYWYIGALFGVVLVLFVVLLLVTRR